jgi:hypothetical protein
MCLRSFYCEQADAHYIRTLIIISTTCMQPSKSPISRWASNMAADEGGEGRKSVQP